MSLGLRLCFIHHDKEREVKSQNTKRDKAICQKKKTAEREQELEVGCQVGDVLLLQSFIAL